MKKRILFIAVTLFAVLTVTGALAAGGVKLNAANFPDAVLREYLEARDDDGNGVLSESEIAQITHVTLSNTAVKDLRGIKYLTSLKYLDVGYTQVNALDLKWAPGLTYLQVSGTNISSLDLGQVPELTELYVTGTDITALDVKKCLKLTVLSCGYTDIGKLDLSSNHALRYLYCGYTDITALDLSGCRLLARLTCSGNKIPGLNLKNNIKLEYLDCSSMGLTSLDVSKLTALQELSCAKNSLTSLDVSRNTKLTSLACWDNKLTELPLSGNTALKFLSCGGNRLTKLTLSANTALYQLDCADNALTKLTLPKGSALRNVYCNDNKLAELNVTGCTGLDTLFCSSNLLTGLNLSKNTLLSSLNCSANRLTELDLSKNWNLSVLTCGGNRLTKLDVSKCTALRRLDARDNQLVFIDLTKNTALSESNISLSGNKRSLTAEAGRIFYADLGLDSAKVSSVKGATKSSTFFTASKSGTVTYQYKVRSDMKVKFTLKVTYKKGEISSVTIDKTSYPYTGKAVRPAVTVKSKIAGRTVKLSKGTQYKVYYKNNVIPGTATITVKGTGHFKGTLTKTFRITKVKLKSVTLDKTTWTYTGSEIRPKVTVKATVDGTAKTLEQGVDYTVKYKNNIKKGTATVTVTGIGNFTGKISKTFKIK